MDFEAWMTKCRVIAEHRGLHLPKELAEDAAFEWKSQFENQMSPEEAVFYYQQSHNEAAN